MALTAMQRDHIRRAIDQRRRDADPPPMHATDRGERRCLAETCLDAAAGDPLLALSYAVDAHQQRRRVRVKNGYIAAPKRTLSR